MSYPFIFFNDTNSGSIFRASLGDTTSEDFVNLQSVINACGYLVTSAIQATFDLCNSSIVCTEPVDSSGATRSTKILLGRTDAGVDCAYVMNCLTQQAEKQCEPHLGAAPFIAIVILVGIALTAAIALRIYACVRRSGYSPIPAPSPTPPDPESAPTAGGLPG